MSGLPPEIVIPEEVRTFLEIYQDRGAGATFCPETGWVLLIGGVPVNPEERLPAREQTKEPGLDVGGGRRRR